MRQMTRQSDAKVDWTIRAARPGEADALSALCLRSKAHWGYDDDFLERCRFDTFEEAAAALENAFVLEKKES